LLDDISRHAARAGLALRWSEVEGDPVALVRVPSAVDEREEEKERRRFVLEEVRLEEGELVVVGRTESVVDAERGEVPANTADQSADSETHQR
jgi:hypothetical protein